MLEWQSSSFATSSRLTLELTELSLVDMSVGTVIWSRGISMFSQ